MTSHKVAQSMKEGREVIRGPEAQKSGLVGMVQ